MSSITSVSPRTLADVIPGGVARSVALVVGGAAFVGLTAQVFVPLPFSPVPLSLQTFSVLLVGAVLGSRPAGLAVLLQEVGVALGVVDDEVAGVGVTVCAVLVEQVVEQVVAQPAVGRDGLGTGGSPARPMACKAPVVAM